jgi:cysteinyl-tRNA synthetase
LIGNEFGNTNGNRESAAVGGSQLLIGLLSFLRSEVRAKKEYALWDRLRDQMQRAGVIVEDEAR